MGIIRPGELELTEEAIGACDFKKGAEVLDVGCGEGDTLAFLAEKYGIKGTGIDRSKTMLERAKKKHPGLNFIEGDAEYLEFTSHTFDGAFMECVLSLVNQQMEALHEIFCVLKKGGKLVLSDLYLKDPDPQAVLEARKKAKIAWTTPHEAGDCGGDEKKPSEYCLDGVFVTEGLFELCEEAGFKTVLWEDKSEELKTFLAEKIFEYGSMDDYWKAVMPEGEDRDYFCKAAENKNLGYFLMVLEKPKA